MIQSTVYITVDKYAELMESMQTGTSQQFDDSCGLKFVRNFDTFNESSLSGVLADEEVFAFTVINEHKYFFAKIKYSI